MSASPSLDELAAQFTPDRKVTEGKWFGKPCLKTEGKVFVVRWGDALVFKLAGEAHAKALAIKGAHLFDPRGTGHPMREWVQIPASQSSAWNRFAESAHQYVAGAKEAKKKRILSELSQIRDNTLAIVTKLSPAEQAQVFLGQWTTREVLAHLVGWDYANIEAVEAILSGRLPAFYAHYDRDWRTFNAHLVAEYSRPDFAKLVASAKESHRQLADLLETVCAEEYDRDRKIRFKGYKVTIARIIQGEIDDEKEHYEQLKSFKNRVQLP